MPGDVILGLTISLDGFAEDRNGSVGALYPDLDTLRNAEYLQESIRQTGAVVMSWKEFSMAEDPDLLADDYEYQVPIFVFTDTVPERHPKENDALTITFVTDGVASAIQQARAAAGDKDVQIIGSAGTTPQVLKTGLADELHIDIIPIFLHEGFRPFDGIGTQSIQLERTKVEALPGDRTHLRFKVRKSG